MNLIKFNEIPSLGVALDSVASVEPRCSSAPTIRMLGMLGSSLSPEVAVAETCVTVLSCSSDWLLLVCCNENYEKNMNY